MPVTWTAEQVIALSPDASSTKAGRDLANPRKWVTLGHDEAAAWGECQGSAKDPYQTQIELGEPAFRCSCPSRKFPCKHALGLFLLLVEKPGSFTQGTPPDWVSSWLAGRTQKAEQKAKKEERGGGVVDEAAQAKRAAERQAKVTAGLEELEQKLSDIVRRGLAAVQGEPFSFWEGMAARLVDAQASGLQGLVRKLAEVPSSGPGWQERLLERLARLQLLLDGYRRLDTLPAELQADIRATIGWAQSQEEVAAQAGVRDRWAVVGQRVEQEDRFRVQRTWLLGAQTGRAALILDFAVADRPLDASLPPGISVDADLAFFTSAYPLRALLKERHGPAGPLAAVPGAGTVAAAAGAYAEALARTPWLPRLPVALAEVVPAVREEEWRVRDAEGNALPLPPRYPLAWDLMALSGGHPVTLFGEWDGDFFLPLSVWAGGRFQGLRPAEQ